MIHLAPVLAAAANIDKVVFGVCTAIVLAGAIGVVLSSNPVYAALSLVLTLFGVAVLFIMQEAQFLAAVQVIVYAGAIVVLFLFVIMLLGVDRRENIRSEPLRGQRILAVLVGIAGLGELFALTRVTWSTGLPSGQPATPGAGNTAALGKSVFSTYLLAFELTSLLLIIAVVGAVILARRPPARRGAPPEIGEERLPPGIELGPGPGVADVDEPDGSGLPAEPDEPRVAGVSEEVAT